MMLINQCRLNKWMESLIPSHKIYTYGHISMRLRNTVRIWGDIYYRYDFKSSKTGETYTYGYAAMIESFEGFKEEVLRIMTTHPIERG